MRRKVVVTALNLMTCLGLDRDSTWQGLLEGRSGIRRISRFDASAYETQIAGDLPGDFDEYARRYCSRRLTRQMARATLMGYVCAKEAVQGHQLDLTAFDPCRSAVVFGLADTGHSAIYGDEFWVLRTMPHGVASLLSMEYRLEGPSLILSAACASSAYALAYGYDLIALGQADLVIAGGTSSILNPEHLRGFNELGALSAANDEPDKASRPFSRGRDGFVIGEGAAVLVLEAEESAQARGAKPYAELAGYAMTNEAYNLMSPAPEGAGMARTLKRSLEHAGLAPEEIDYINAHGTSTQLNDKLETLAIKQVFGEAAYRIPVSSAKSMIGHTAGACGAVEAAITALSLHHGMLTPTINYTPDAELDLDYVPDRARRQNIRAAISNSFGFGGCNASLVLRKCGPAV